jgi:hypothetical protein
MKLCWAATLVALGMACVMRDPAMVKTQVITFPDGALIEYNGTPHGRAPAEVILPQDSSGRLTGHAVVRALPNTAQSTLYAQSRVFDPSNRTDRVPDRIMIDMTLRDINAPASIGESGSVETSTKASARTQRKPVDRGKPTQPVGLDRWNPGIH